MCTVRIKILLLILLLQALLSRSDAQDQSLFRGLETQVYVDSSIGISFKLPKWFSAAPSRFERDAIDVQESGEPSFTVLAQRFDDTLDPKIRTDIKYRGKNLDVFSRVAQQEAFRSLMFIGASGVAHGRIDSIKEYRTASNLRVIGIFRTQVIEAEDGSKDSNATGPVYCVDISPKRPGFLIEFDFQNLAMNLATYSSLVEAIPLSIELSTKITHGD